MKLCELFNAVYFVSFVSSVIYAFNDWEPLILTPLIEKGGKGISKALELSRVSEDIAGVESYTGFFTVNEKCGSNLFFWFIPTESNWENTPLLLWLSGGVGDVAISGAFEEFGPWEIKNGKIVRRMNSETLQINLLFLDTTPGVGFSFTENKCYPNSVTSAVKETYSALTQFYTMFSSLIKNKLIITGRYFVSHFGPALALLIKDKQKRHSGLDIILKGVLIINARTSFDCHDFSDQIYHLGIVDQGERDQFKDYHSDVAQTIRKRQFAKAAELEYSMFEKLKSSPYIALPSYYNFAADNDIHTEFVDLLLDPQMRKQIHVGNIDFDMKSKDIHTSLLSDHFGSPKTNIETLLESEEIHITFYNSQLDIYSSYSSTLCFLKTLEWSGSSKFSSAHRYQWKLTNDVAGWYKVSGSLLHVLVRKQGHYLSMGDSKVAQIVVKAMLGSASHHLFEALQPK